MNFAAVARRFEAKHLQLTLALADESLELSDESFAAFAGAGAYSNRVTGFGLAPEHIDRAIAFFSDRGEDTKLETTSFAPPPLLEAIRGRGFELRFFTHVMAAPVKNVPRRPPPAGITIERLDRDDPKELRAAAEHNERCFAVGRELSETSIALTMRHLAMPTNDTFLARDRGELVGVGCSESSHGVTLLFGGAVVPTHRGRGIQQALINVRLAAAHERDSELACVMTNPGTPSERNACRNGFQLVGTHIFFGRSRSQ